MSTKAANVEDAGACSAVHAESSDVPLGYKRTEVGVIPKDWTPGLLSSAVAALQAGVSVNSTVEDSVGDGRPAILKTSCVQSGTFLPHEAKAIALKDRHRAKLNPRRDAILISRMNTIELVGECRFVDRDYPDLFIPDRLWMTQFHAASSVSARWLAYVLSSAAYRKQLQSIATGTSGSMKNIAKGSLLGLPIAFPDPPEQRAIAEADVDGLLEALAALSAKERAIEQAAMQQLLTGRIRLSGFSGEWETKRVGEIGTTYGGLTGKTKRFSRPHWAVFVGTPGTDTLFVGLYAARLRPCRGTRRCPHRGGIDRAGSCDVYDLTLEEPLSDLTRASSSWTGPRVPLLGAARRPAGQGGLRAAA